MSLPSMRRSDVFNASIRYCIRFELLNRDMNSKLQSGSTLWTWCKRYKDVHLQRSMQHLNPLRAILCNQYVSRLSPLPGLSVSWLQLVFRFGRPLNLLGTFASFAAGFRFLRSAEMELFRWHLNRQRLKHLLRIQGNAFRKVKWCNGASPDLCLEGRCNACSSPISPPQHGKTHSQRGKILCSWTKTVPQIHTRCKRSIFEDTWYHLPSLARLVFWLHFLKKTSESLALNCVMGIHRSHRPHAKVHLGFTRWSTCSKRSQLILIQVLSHTRSWWIVMDAYYRNIRQYHIMYLLDSFDENTEIWCKKYLRDEANTVCSSCSSPLRRLGHLARLWNASLGHHQQYTATCY